MLAGCYSDRSGWLLAQLAERGYSDVDLIEVWTHAANEAFARFRRGDAARRPRQQPNSKSFFEGADRVTEGRLRHAELCSSLRETFLLRHGQEGEKIIDVLAAHS
jgi:hypothetical protein